MKNSVMRIPLPTPPLPKVYEPISIAAGRPEEHRVDLYHATTEELLRLAYAVGLALQVRGFAGE